MAGRDAAYADVRCAVAQRLRAVGAGQQGGEMADVELRLDQVGEREGGGGVRGAARPGRVEDGPGTREVADHGDAAAGLDDGGVAAGPLGEVAQRAAAGGVEGPAQFLVGGAAAAEDGEPGEGVGGVGGEGADLVRAPVADGPERVGVAPQELGAHGDDGAVGFGGARVVGVGGVGESAADRAVSPRVGARAVAGAVSGVVSGAVAVAMAVAVLPAVARGVCALVGGVRGVLARDPSGRAEARGDTAPTHQPAHRRLHSLWAHDRGTNGTVSALGATGGTPGGSGSMLPRDRRARVVMGGARTNEHAPTMRYLAFRSDRPIGRFRPFFGRTEGPPGGARPGRRDPPPDRSATRGD